MDDLSWGFDCFIGLREQLPVTVTPSAAALLRTLAMAENM